MNVYDLMADDGTTTRLVNINKSNIEKIKHEGMFSVVAADLENFPLDKGEKLCYYEWVGGPLAARGALVAINDKGEITKQKVLWMS